MISMCKCSCDFSRPLDVVLLGKNICTKTFFPAVSCLRVCLVTLLDDVLAIFLCLAFLNCENRAQIFSITFYFNFYSVAGAQKRRLSCVTIFCRRRQIAK